MTTVEGKTVATVRPMTNDELDREGWGHFRGNAPAVIVFEDGTKVYASSDSEGNGPGVLYGVGSDGELFGFSV